MAHGAFRTAGTPYDSASVAVTVTPALTVPASVVATDATLLAVSWVGVAGEVPPTVTPSGTGWVTLVAPRTDNNMGWAVYAKPGLVASDTFTVTFGNARLVTASHTYWKTTAGLATSGPVASRGGVSGSVNTAPALPVTQVEQTVVVVSVERTTATGTTATPSKGAQHQLYEGTGTSTCSVFVGSFTGPDDAGESSGEVVVTYNSGSGNGAAVQVLLLDEAAAGSSPAETGSPYQLLAIVDEAIQTRRAELAAAPTACPNDGEPLRTGPDGRLYCPFDGWPHERAAANW